MCDCISKVNEALAKSNARLATKLTLNMKNGIERSVVPIPLEKINQKPRKPLPGLVPRFCVFCGEKRVTA